MTTTLLATSAHYEQPDVPVRRVRSGKLLWQQPQLVQTNTTIVQDMDRRMPTAAVVPHSLPSAVYIDGAQLAHMGSADNGSEVRWVDFRTQFWSTVGE